MEERMYLMNACTAWTLADDFENFDCWDDSIKDSEIVQQIIRTKPIHNLKEEKKFSQNLETYPVIDHAYSVGKASEKVLPRMEDVENQGVEGDIVQMTTVREHGYPQAFGDIISNAHHNLSEEKPERSPSRAQPLVLHDSNGSFWQHIQPKTSSAVISGKKRFICSCGNVLSVSRSLNISLRAYTGQQYFKCPLCDSLLVLRLSTGKQFSFTQCSYSCSQQSDLTAHMQTHACENSIICDVCHKSFTSSSDLEAHQEIHSNEKPFTCNVCHKSFSESSNLKRHLQIHTKEKPFDCEHCGKCFSRAGNLKVHLLTHTKEKPQECEQCRKCFTLKGHLTAHIRTHTGEKPYSCQTCGKSFATSSCRNRHSWKCSSTTTIKEDS